jgi:hypothetical protein
VKNQLPQEKHEPEETPASGKHVFEPSFSTPTLDVAQNRRMEAQS